MNWDWRRKKKTAYMRGMWGNQLEISCIIKEKLCFCLGGGWKECLGKGLWLLGSLFTKQSRIPQHTEEEVSRRYERQMSENGID